MELACTLHQARRGEISLKEIDMRTLTVFALAAMTPFITAVAAAQDPLDNAIELYSRPNQFYLFDETSVKVLDFNSERDVRICAETRQHGIGLEVDYDNKSTVVRPGDCFEFEAMTVSIEPAGQLPPNVDLSGTIETRK
jgi:hypothetical protein